MITSVLALSDNTYEMEAKGNFVKYLINIHYTNINTTSTFFSASGNTTQGTAYLGVFGITTSGELFVFSAEFKQKEILKNNPSVFKVNVEGDAIYTKRGQDSILFHYDSVNYTFNRGLGTVSLSAEGDGRFFIRDLIVTSSSIF